MSTKTGLQLNGSDAFLLVLERLNKATDLQKNVCIYQLELGGNFDIDSFMDKLAKNEIAQWLSRFHVRAGSRNWHQSHTNHISVTELPSDYTLDEVVKNVTLSAYSAPLFEFHVIRKENGTSLFFSWHHVLMDGYGATLFLFNLEKPISIREVINERSPFNWKTLKAMTKAKRYLDKSASGSIASLENPAFSEVLGRRKIIAFTEEESARMEQMSREKGAKFGPGIFFLAASAKAVQQLRKRKGLPDADFWIPLPQDARRKGSNWPVLGNHLSFLFYRMKQHEMEDSRKLVASLTSQLTDQIKREIPKSYHHLQHFLRKLPVRLYSHLVKGPNGESISTFLFTMASPHPEELKSLHGCPIQNAWSFPPLSSPPGLTIAVNRFERKFSFLVVHSVTLFSEEEYAHFERDLRAMLLDGN